MKQQRKIEYISIGGWFQRTALHLSEMYDFLKYAESPLALDGEQLKKLRENISPLNLKFHVGELDHITFSTKNYIDVKIYEDGLITLTTAHIEGGIQDEVARLTDFYEKKVSPGFSYIFSLGAPVPKELANIKTIYPYFVVFDNKEESEVISVFEDLKEEIHLETHKGDFDITRGDKLYVINNRGKSLDLIDDFIEEVIFTREFRGQMHRYLNLHRIIWEKIANIKERGSINGSDIKNAKNMVSRYAKSINLISARINQMDAYIGTRGKISHKHLADTDFIEFIGYRYETLHNTLKYLKHVWKMTENYVKSADKIFGDLQSKATSNSIKTLTVITSMGVGASLIKLFNTGEMDFEPFGIVYVGILAAIGYGVNRLMNWWGMRSNYSIKHDELNIKD